MNPLNSLPFVDFEALEDRLLFSATPFMPIDAVDDESIQVHSEEMEPALLPGDDESAESSTEDSDVSAEDLAGSGEAAEADPAKVSVLEDSLHHSLVLEDLELEEDLITSIMLDNDDVEETAADWVATATGDVTTRLEILFVDPSVEGHESLSAGLRASAPADVNLLIYELDPNRNGLEQISEVLTEFQKETIPVDGLHIVSHAAPGQMRLGDTQLNTQSLSADTSVAETLESWKEYLSEEADILLYGCDLADGEIGWEFVQNLADLTGADVAASTDATGAEHLGGNWVMESSTGLIESAVLVSTADILLAGSPVPVVTVDADPTPFVGEAFEVGIDFENQGILADDTGYGPFVDLRVSPGAEVVGGLGGFTYLGLPVNVLGFYENNTALPMVIDHPIPEIAGLPMDAGEITLAAGESYYVLELPFGSFAVNQPGAEINFTAITSRAANPTENFFPEEAGAIGSVSFQVGGGFRFGGDPLDNPGVDAPIYVAPVPNNEVGTAGDNGNPNSFEVRPRVWEVTTDVLEQEGQAATGPNDPQTWQILVDIATGETLTNIVIGDVVADNLQYINNLTVTDSNGNPLVEGVDYTVSNEPSLVGPGGDLSITISDEVLGVAGNDITISYETYVPYLDADGETVLVPSTGSPVDISNSVVANGTWIYDLAAYGLDPVDGILTVTDSALGDDGLRPNVATLSAESITIHKGVTNLTSGGSDNFIPGDELEWNLFIQVSDYFQFDDLYMIDTLGDGQLFIDSAGAVVAGALAPTFTWTEEGAPQSLAFDISAPSANLSPIPDVALINFGNFVVFHNGTQSAQTFDASLFQASAPNNISVGVGETVFLFRVSEQMIDAGADGILKGDGLNGGNLVSVTDATRDAELATNIGQGQTTATITFRSVAQEAYVLDLVPGENNNIDMDDSIGNRVDVNGQILDNTDDTPQGRVEEGSGAGVSVPGPTLDKSLSFINGLAPGADPVVDPGGTVTWGLNTTLSTADTENLTIIDYVPLPKFEVAEFGAGPDITGAITVFAVSDFDPLTDIPPAGEIYLVLGDDLFEELGGTLGNTSPGNTLLEGATIDEDTNSFTISVGTFGLPAAEASLLANRTIDIFFTLTATDEPMVDGLFLTNQQRVTYNNTEDAVSVGDAIVQVRIAEPIVSVDKGVVASSQGGGLLLGGVQFDPIAGSGFTGDVENAAQASAIGGSDLITGTLPDAADSVRYAIVLQNTGRADAFNVTAEDTIDFEHFFTVDPANVGDFVADTNFTVFTGDGTALVQGVDYNLSYTYDVGTETGSFEVVMIDGGDGFLQAGAEANGDLITGGLNSVVITYDLMLAASMPAGFVYTNTAALTNYTGVETGGINRVPDGLEDSADIRTQIPDIQKSLVETEVVDANNSNTQAAIGELVTYEVVITVPEGTTYGAAITDRMDRGLAFVGVVSVSSSAGVTFDAPEVGVELTPDNTTVSAVGGQDGRRVEFDLGNIINTNTDNADTETITIRYTAVVTNIAGNQTGNQRNNSADFNWDDELPADNLSDNAANVRVIEPTLSVEKEVENVTSSEGPANSVDGDADDVIQYTITITNGNGGNDRDAYELSLSDLIPSALNGLSIVSVNSTGTVNFSTATLPDSFEIVGQTLQTIAGADVDLLKNSTITIVVEGTFAGNTGGIVTNEADIQWTSMDGTPGGGRNTHNANGVERDGSGVGPNDYNDSDTAQITTAPLVFKQIVSTSEADTGAETAGAGFANADVDGAVGEIVRYRLVVGVPEGEAENFQIQDHLPEGLQFLNDGSARFLLVSDGGTQITSTGISDISALAGGTSGAALAGITSSDVNGVFADNNIATSIAGAGTGEGAVFSSGQDVFFRMGDITNDTSNGDPAYAIIEFNALVSNLAGNQSATTLPNDFGVLVDVNNDGTPTVIDVIVDANGDGEINGGEGAVVQVSNTVNVAVVEPELTISNDIDIASGDAGDEATITMVVENTGNATSFDNIITNQLDPDKFDLTTLDLGTVGVDYPVGYTPSVNLATGVLTWDGAGGELAIAGTQTFTFTVDLRGSATGVVAGETLDSDAEVTYTSLPGAGTVGGFNVTGSSTPGASGDPTGERDGSGGVNDYVATASDSLRIDTPDIDKELVGGQTEFTIGDTITYRLTVTLPEAVTEALIITDLVQADAGGVLEILSATMDSSSPDLGALAPVIVISDAQLGDGINDTATLTFGDVINLNTDNGAAETIEILVEARVANVGANQAGDTLSNTGRLTYTDGDDGETSENTPPVDITVVEPQLEVVKDITTPTGNLDAGDLVTYTVTVQHTGASSATAYEVIINDAMPGELENYTLVSAFIGAVDVTGLFNFNAATGVLSTTGDIDLALADELVITLSGTVRNATVVGTQIVNSATVLWSSQDDGLAGDDAGTLEERTGTGGGPNDYDDEDSAATQTRGALSVVKSADVATATIGDIVTYTLSVEVAEGQTALNLVDTLPGGMGLVANSVLIGNNTDNLDIVGLNDDSLTQNLTITSTQSTNDGGVAHNSTFTISYEVIVLNVADNTGLLGDQTALTNTVVATADLNDDGDTTDPDESVTDGTTTDVIEPELEVLKTTVGDVSGLDAGDTVTYQITVSHTGNSLAPAWDVVLNDMLPAELRNHQLVSAQIGATNVAGQLDLAGANLTTSGTINLALGEELVITVSGIVRDDTNVGTTINNEALLYWSSLENGQRGDQAGISDGENDERTGVGGGANDYNDADDVDVVTQGVLEMIKTADKTDATIGEIITYTLEVTVAEGRTVLNFTDTLPADTLLVANSVQLASNPDGLDIQGLSNNTVTGQALTITSDGTVDPDSATVETSTFTISYQVIVLNVADNTGLLGNQTALTNTVVTTADLNDDGDTTDPDETVNDGTTTDVIEPDLVIEKSHNDVDGIISPGQTIDYEIVLTHTGSSLATAFDVALIDQIPVGLTLVPGSLNISTAGGVTGLVNNSVGGNFNITADTFDQGASITITYRVTANLHVVGATNFDNNARVNFASAPGGTPEERTYEPNPGIELPNVDTDPRQDTERVTVGTASLGDYVWYDVNGDGVQDANEFGIAGVDVILTGLNADGVTTYTVTATTDADGLYTFPSLAPGNYSVTVDFSTLPDGGATVPTFDIEGATDGVANNVVVTDGVTRTDVDFGFRGTSTIGDLVWLDLDGSGTVTGFEPGIPNVTLNLIWDADDDGIDGADPVIGTVTTDANGNYSFGDLMSGNYRVLVTDNSNVLDDAVATYDLDGTTISPSGSSTINGLAIGATREDADFGYRGAASIGDRVWNDLNGDATQEAGEFGIEGLTVNLYQDLNNDGLLDVGDQLIATTLTGSNGIYNVAGLIADDYLVEIDTPPPGSTQTYDLDGLGSQDVALRNLGSDEQATDVDFGYIGQGSIGDDVWYDVDGDGVQDGFEPPLEGVRVYIDVDGSGDFDAAVDPFVVTDANGFYEFTGLIGGTYTVVVDQSTLPTGFVPTWDRDSLLVDPDAIAMVTLAPSGAGATVTDADFGFFGSFTLSGTVYHDLDKGGVQNGSDPGLGGVTVELYDSTGTILLKTTTTDVNGDYDFDDVLPGDYIIRQIQPAGYGSSQTPGNEWPVTVVDSSIGGFHFGETTGSLAGTVFLDSDNNGIQTPGEMGIGEVEMTLLWSGADGVFGTADDRTVTTLTDRLGNYLFDYTNTAGFGLNGTTDSGLLSTGSYRIFQTQPSEFVDGQDRAGDASGATGSVRDPFGNGGRGADLIDGVQIGTGQDAGDYTFGELPGGMLSGDVFIDSNGNGTKELTERGIPNVLITLEGFDDLGNPVFMTTTTDQDGFYSFMVLPPSNAAGYTITQTQPEGLRDGPDYVGTQGGRLGGMTPQSDVIMTTTFGIGTIGEANNFTELRPLTALSSVPSVTPIGGFFAIPEPIVSPVATYFMTTLRPIFGDGGDWDYLHEDWELVDSTAIFSSPVLTGAAEPGSKVVMALYNHRGELVSTVTVLADMGGNWATGFPGVKVDGPITVVSTVSAGDFEAMNTDDSFNFRTNYVTGVPGGFFQSRDNGVSEVFSHLSENRLEAMVEEDNAGAPWTKHSYEFLSQPALPGN